MLKTKTLYDQSVLSFISDMGFTGYKQGYNPQWNYWCSFSCVWHYCHPLYSMTHNRVIHLMCVSMPFTKDKFSSTKYITALSVHCIALHCLHNWTERKMHAFLWTLHPSPPPTSMSFLKSTVSMAATSSRALRPLNIIGQQTGEGEIVLQCLHRVQRTC